MKRRLFCLLAALVLALAMQIPVYANNVLDWTQDGKGSITIHLNYDEDTADLGSLRLYRVGDVQDDDGDLSFAPRADFAAVWAEDADLQDPAFAWDLTTCAVDQERPFETVEVTAEGAVFEELEIGLYLVCQNKAAEGYEAINPFLIGVPNVEEDLYVYQVDASPKVAVTPAPTNPPKPTEPKPTRPPEPSLPQTGQTNWPIPLMAAAGLLLFAAGWSMYRKGRYES